MSSAPFGSAGILPISWAYIAMMGADGLTEATQVAILSANYIAHRLHKHFPVLYRGHGDLVAHECIIDVRGLTKTSGVTVDDIAKRLIDYGFHAPTMSFPVPGTFMVEPTESESLPELDRFCDAMISIREEIDADRTGSGRAGREPADPRTAHHAGPDRRLDAGRTHVRSPRSRPVTHPTSTGRRSARIDQAYGDRHLVCSCPPPEAFEQ